MEAIKSYTDINQSKKLAEILLKESADMGLYYSRNPQVARNQMWVATKTENADIPCWSLAALLGVMPKDKSIECSISFGYYNGRGEYVEKWLCTFEKEGETTDDYIIETTDGDNPVDACVAMIIKLKERNLI